MFWELLRFNGSAWHSTGRKFLIQDFLRALYAFLIFLERRLRNFLRNARTYTKTQSIALSLRSFHLFLYFLAGDNLSRLFLYIWSIKQWKSLPTLRGFLCPRWMFSVYYSFITFFKSVAPKLARKPLMTWKVAWQIYSLKNCQVNADRRRVLYQFARLLLWDMSTYVWKENYFFGKQSANTLFWMQSSCS